MNGIRPSGCVEIGRLKAMQGSNDSRKSEIFTQQLVRLTARRGGARVPNGEDGALNFLALRLTFTTATVRLRGQLRGQTKLTRSNNIATETKKIKLANAEDVRLATRVASPFSVEITEGRDTVRLQRVRFGVAGQAFEDTNYAFLRRGETIPWGSIRAVPRFVGGTEITYKIRAGSDFTGDPEF